MVKIIPIDENDIIISENSNKVNKCREWYEKLNDKTKCSLFCGLIMFIFLSMGLFLFYYFTLKK